MRRSLRNGKNFSRDNIAKSAIISVSSIGL